MAVAGHPALGSPVDGYGKTNLKPTGRRGDGKENTPLILPLFFANSAFPFIPIARASYVRNEELASLLNPDDAEAVAILEIGKHFGAEGSVRQRGAFGKRSS